MADKLAYLSPHDYLNGRVVARERANQDHSLIQVSLIVHFVPQARSRDCQVHASDMRVSIPACNTYVYPDLSVVRGKAHFEDELRDNLLNPIAIIEIQSPSTALYDRTEKFARYRQIPTLREYLLIAQNTPAIEHFVRQPDDQWLWSLAEQLTDTITLPSVDCTLALADIYADIAFE
jgi:Uma2 family endonuclease